MDRAFESGAAASPPTVPASPSVGYPTAGNPATATPATKPGPWWYYMITEELRNLIVDAGLTPDEGDLTQLSQAVQTLIAALRGQQIQPIGASVAANALTVTVQPTALDFRDATLSSGTVNTRTLAAAASLVVPSGATLGTANGVLSRLAVLLLDNAGTLEPAIVNLAGGVSLDETGVISTTAISGAANSASVVYSQSARANLPYRVVGVVESTQVAAGTWATAPSRVQGTGGQAFAAMQSLGVGQTWQDVKISRVVGTTYYNTTGRPITVAISAYRASAVLAADFNVDGSRVAELSASTQTGDRGYAYTTVPAGASYALVGTSVSVASWTELR